MPANFEMSWEGKSRRWWKQYKKIRHVVSCRQLGAWASKTVPETKEGSYQVANAWWRAKKLEIDGQGPVNPHEAEIAELLGRRDFARSRGAGDLAGFFDSMVKRLEQDPESTSFLETNREYRRMAIQTMFGTDWTNLPEWAIRWLGDDEVWRDRLANEQADPIPEEQTIHSQVERWMAWQQTRVHAGQIAAGSFENTRHCVQYFRDWVNGQLSIESINESVITDFHTHLLSKIAERHKDPKGKAGWSPDYAKKLFGVVRKFVRHLSTSCKHYQTPRNLDSRDMDFDVSAKAIVTMTNQEIEKLLHGAKGQLRLHLLLMLNCGFTQTDVSDLKDHEVDWTSGRINRKRSKTEDEKNVPVVSYKLWPITFELLSQYRSGAEHVLVTKAGRPWVWEVLKDDGEFRSSDSIATNYRKLRKAVGVDKSLKIFRKTSATRLKSNLHYAMFDVHFLGHAPSTIADKHYSGVSGELFDQAVTWLGEQYGLI